MLITSLDTNEDGDTCCQIKCIQQSNIPRNSKRKPHSGAGKDGKGLKFPLSRFALEPMDGLILFY